MYSFTVKSKARGLLAGLLSMLPIHLALSQDVVESESGTLTLSPLTVIGDADEVWNQVGSSAYIDTTEIRTHGYTNASRVLMKVPGVYVRDEDGFGNFPNISLRGADGTRSEKATIMEDGILSAPAPYSAPGAYYSPKIARMSGIEVLKGSSQVRYGPHTTGGVINYLSTQVPEDFEAYLRYTYGSFETHTLHATVGDVVETSAGKLSYVLELFGQSSEGFREIQKHAGEGTGFETIEPMVKVVWEPNTEMEQRFEFKFGYTDFDADESYLGLSERDVRNHPHDRYAATVFDNIDTDHLRTSLKYVAKPTDAITLESTLYFNRFNRNWFKLDHVSTAAIPLIDSKGRIDGRTSLSKALFEGSAALDVLKGNTVGSIGVKANNRSYESYGWQNAATFEFETGALQHSLTAGLRLHYDHEDRYHWVNVYTGRGNGAFDLFRQGIPGEETDARQEVFATSVFLEDTITWGKLTLRPGIRYEYLDMEYTAPGTLLSDTLDVWAAGIGFQYEFNDDLSLFGGVYRGISTPGPSAYLNDDIDVEESTGYELGIRYRQEGHFLVELVGFVTDYANLVGTDTGLGLGGGSNLNAGEALVAGIEASVRYDAGVANNLGFGLPVYVSATWTHSELENALAAGGGDDIYAGGPAGADIPYVPEWKVSAGIGYAAEKWGVNFDMTYQSATSGTAAGYDAPLTSAREGIIDEILIFDLSVYYQVHETTRLVFGVQNLFDDTYISSRIPEGPRNGAPRQWYAGLELKF